MTALHVSEGRSAPFHPPFEASPEYLRTEPKFMDENAGIASISS